MTSCLSRPLYLFSSIFYNKFREQSEHISINFVLHKQNIFLFSSLLSPSTFFLSSIFSFLLSFFLPVSGLLSPFSFLPFSPFSLICENLRNLRTFSLYYINKLFENYHTLVLRETLLNDNPLYYS